MQLPKYTSPEEASTTDRKRRRGDKRRRLEVIEEILWRKGTSSSPQSGWNPAGAYLGRLQARALQKFVAFVVQFAVVDARDIEIQYTQRGEPGPRPSSNYLQGADAAVLQIRSLMLQPQGTSVGRGNLDNDDDGDDPSDQHHTGDSSSSTPIGSPRGGGHNTIKIGFGSGNSGESSSSEEPTLLHALSSIPQLLWSNVITHRPSATELSVKGVNIVLKTYPTTWRGYHAAISAARASHARSIGPFVFPSPTRYALKSAGAHRGRVESRHPKDGGEGQGVPKRRRADAANVDVKSLDGGAASTSKSPSKHAKDAETSSDTNKNPMGIHPTLVNHAAMLQETIAEEHIIVKQWEFMILLRLLPPGYAREDAVSFVSSFTAAPPPTEVAPAQPSSQPNELPAAATIDNAAAAISNDPSSSVGRTPATGSTRKSFSARRPSGRHLISLRGLSSVYGRAGDAQNNNMDHIFSGGLEHIDDTKSFLQEIIEEKKSTESDEESIESTEFLTPAASMASTMSSRESSPVGRGRGARGLKEEVETGKLNGTHGASTVAKSQTDGMPESSAQKNETSASKANCPTSQYILDVSITLKALIPELNAASSAIVSRVIDRHLHVNHYGKQWACRPQVPVEDNEALWWQHAGRAIAAGTRLLSRREVPLSKLEQRRTARLEYQALYAAMHLDSPYFKEPGRQWWQFSQIKSNDEQDKKRLAALEDSLTLEELAHFRFGVAARYNACLVEDSELAHFIANKIDALVCTKKSNMQPHLADLLLHRDREAMHMGGTLGSKEASKKGRKKDDGIMFGVRVSLTCPKVGIALDTRRCATAPGTTDDARYTVLSLKSIIVDIETAGSMRLAVKELECGPAALPTSSPTTKLLACPSRVCQDVCKAAEFFRYATTGHVQSRSLGQDDHCFARVTISPRYGVGGRAVGEKIVDASAIDRWHPAGFNIRVELAAMGIVYDNASATSLLALAGHWDEYKKSPWRWSMPDIDADNDGEQHSFHNDGETAARKTSSASVNSDFTMFDAPDKAGTSGRPVDPPMQWPPLLRNPQTVEGMVLNTFSAAQVPVLGTLLLPVTNLEVNCPGIAIQLPYTHRSASIILRKKWKLEETQTMRADKHSTPTSPLHSESAARVSDDGSNSGPDAASSKKRAVDDESDGDPESLQYMFTVTLQNIDIRIAGDEFGRAFKGGNARRIEAEGFLDIFSYLSIDARRIVARRLGKGRFVFDAVRRMFTEETSSVDSIEEELREMEIPCMAKVWAYPEDMPLIIKAVRERGYLDGDEPMVPSCGPTYAVMPSLMSMFSMRSASTTTASHFKGDGGAGMSAALGLRQSMPDLLNKPEMYPIPLIPYLKAKPIRGSVVHRLSAMPDDPGGTVLAAAVSVNATQAWVSPIHIWHLISLERAIQQIIDYFLRSSIVESFTTETKSSTERDVNDGQEMSAVRPSRRLLFTFDIQAVSLLWLVCCCVY